MLAMHPDCERCGADLPAQAPGAFICSFECTFCAECADALDERCPNCGGELVDRPTRTGERLKRNPAATERRYKSPSRVREGLGEEVPGPASGQALPRHSQAGGEK